MTPVLVSPYRYLYGLVSRSINIVASTIPRVFWTDKRWAEADAPEVLACSLPLYQVRIILSTDPGPSLLNDSQRPFSCCIYVLWSTGTWKPTLLRQCPRIGITLRNDFGLKV